MAQVRRLVIDVLKPHDPPLVEFTRRVTEVGSVDAAVASLIEMDREVQNVVVTVEGKSVDNEAVEKRVESLGATVHSVDTVACGDRVLEDRSSRER